MSLPLTLYPRNAFNGSIKSDCQNNICELVIESMAHFLKKGARVHNNIRNKMFGSILNETLSLYTTKKSEYKSLKQY